jgi:transcriptional regulator with AAA-type ATPase domain
MVNKTKLSEFDRTFFELVADATFSNPFSLKRQELDRKIVALATQESVDDMAWSKLVPLVVERLEHTITTLERQGMPAPVKIEHFEKGDQELMKQAFLFLIFHKTIEDLDELIRKRERSPEKNTEVPFASRAIRQMTQRGFTNDEAVRYFELFYQIRRAFYFILQGLVGQSDCMRQLRMDLWNNIFTHDIRDYERHLWNRMEDFATLLEGPTGCGKGAAAAAIGKSCFIPFDAAKNTFESNFMELFVPANLSLYSTGVLESELFGHVQGAFTGAVKDYEGLFGQCRPHGTIFLDEIGELSTQVQVKLLKVLEERTYTPVGSNKARRFHGRVIAATNRPVAELRRQGAFRDDFYYRLCADCIVVPSLALRVEQNPEELREMVEHFTRQMTNDYNPKLAERVMEVIGTRLSKNYAWPGNVRELAQCIRRVILKDDYRPDETPRRTRLETIMAGIEKESFSEAQLTSQYCKFLFDRYGSYKDVARITGLAWSTAKGKTIGD